MTKKNNITLRNISITIGIFLAVGSIVWTFVWVSATRSSELDSVIEDVVKAESNIENIKNIDMPNLEADIEYHDDRLYEQEKEVFGVKKELGYLGEKVDRNFEEQQKFQVEQRVVQKEILKEIKGLQK